MAASYPSSLPIADAAGANLSSNPHSALHDDMYDEIVAIATELGTNPKGTSASVKARLDLLSGFVGNVKAAQVLTSETTTSTSFVDLSTVGPAVTCDTGTSALVLLHADMETTGSVGTAVVSVAVSGSTTIPASNASVISVRDELSGAGTNVAVGGFVLITGMNAGSHTFTAKYRVTAGTGVFASRRLAVIPLI